MLKKGFILISYCVALMILLITLITKLSTIGFFLYVPLGIVLAIPFKYVSDWLDNRNNTKEERKTTTIKKATPIELDMWDKLADYAM